LACVPVYWFIAQNIADDHEKLLVMLIPPFVYIPCGTFIAIAARRVRHHKNHTLAVVATGMGMVMALGTPLTIPIGIWVLVRLYDPKVRAMFAGGQPLGVMRGDRRRIPVAETEARGSVLCLPVKLGSLSEHRYPGMLRLDGDALVLEYMKGYVRAKVKEATIQIRHIHQLRLTSGWFFDSLVLQTASLKALESIPNSAQGRLVLSISRSDRAAAERLIRAIQEKVPAVHVEGPLADWPGEDLPVAMPAVPAPQQTGLVHRKLRSLFNSVYTMFFSRVKIPESPTNNPAHEHPAGQP